MEQQIQNLIAEWRVAKTEGREVIQLPRRTVGITHVTSPDLGFRVNIGAYQGMPAPNFEVLDKNKGPLDLNEDDKKTLIEIAYVVQQQALDSIRL